MRSIHALPALALPLLCAQTAPPPASPAPAALLAKVEALLAEGPTGTRYGLLVTDMDGRQLLAIAPDQRFIPASNTKMFTTATAYSELPQLDQAAHGTGVRDRKSTRLNSSH